jgi:hypothetical protein
VPTPIAAPGVSGVAQSGQVLKAKRGTWSSPDRLTFAYQWERCNVATGGCSGIAGATGASYRLTSADIGAMVTVTISATDEEEQRGQATAPAIGPVTG